MATSFPQFKNWSDKDVQRLFRQRDSIRDKNRAQYQGFNDDYYKNTMSFKPLLDALKPTHKRIKKIKDLAKDFKLKMPEHINKVLDSFDLDNKLRTLAITLNSIPNDPINIELKQDILDNVFEHQIDEQEAFIDGYMAKGESIYNNSDLPTEQLYPSASEFVRDDRDPIDDYVRDDEEQAGDIEALDFSHLNFLADKIGAVFGWIYDRTQYSDEFEQAVFAVLNVEDTPPPLPSGPLPPRVPRPSFQAGYFEKLKGKNGPPDNVPDILKTTDIAPDIQNLISKEGKLIAQEDIEDLLNLRIQEDRSDFAERLRDITKRALLDMYPTEVVDIITSYWTDVDEDYILRDMLALVVDDLKTVVDMIYTRRAREILGYSEPSSLGFNQNGQLMFLNEQVGLNGINGHIIHNGNRYKLNLNMLKLFLSYNPFVINEMTDNDTRRQFLGIVKAMEEQSPTIERLLEDESKEGTKLGEILKAFRDAPLASLKGTGYKSQMKLKKQIQTLNKRTAKRTAKRVATEKARTEQSVRDFAPLIDEIRQIERQIHDTSRVLKGKPKKVRDGTANVSKKTGRIKRHTGKGGFSNSDAFFTGSKRKSVRDQAQKQVKDKTTFGSGLPSLETLSSKLMLLKGSQMAGNTGKKIKNEISKIEQKLK
jgi:hypothetical protein